MVIFLMHQAVSLLLEWINIGQVYDNVKGEAMVGCSVIGVMGGADVPVEVMVLAEELGRRVAEKGWILLNGGRDCGVMQASAKGAFEAGGLTVGILPGTNLEGVSPWVRVPVVTGMGDARNAINVLSSRVVVALAGGAGTLSEIALAVKSNIPVLLLSFDPGCFEKEKRVGRVRWVRTAEEAVAAIEGILS